MSEESLITDEARAMIGREGEPVTSGPVTELEIMTYCEAVGDLNPLYVDKAAAESGPYGGIIAPPLSHPVARGMRLTDLREDGLPAPKGRGGMVPLKVTRTMAGGTETEFVNPIRPGDMLTSRSKIADIYERTGRSGSRLVFVVTETVTINQNGEVVTISRTTGISR
ncbi:MAG: MaoC family dehydratase N-terminal domain-containing protein [Dehalococcoidales bacterium]